MKASGKMVKDMEEAKQLTMTPSAHVLPRHVDVDMHTLFQRTLPDKRDRADMKESGRMV